ncbi:polymerase [Bradyrhizobium sacchari]|uniref:Porin n=1 Tax=Bradyrhizobium sacchari TaxID=1399419 RepID=A0A560K7F4_9BRAD|nr:porin [Bradyrhizobium sacchari]OPY97168.1 polymerase [Bradyrhizobium sacchari]TWB55762.1 porin-like protein [Bradyrhizobium sacchari]TWB78929.1 porin-like protein [Bradyrhizobium sacchari]
MRMVKSLLLGTAAGLIAVGGAQAADLPVKAKAVEYVKVCSLYGAGFYYIPGSDTCIKLGGYLRAEVALNAGGHFNAQYNNVFAANNRLNNYYSMRAREDLNIDTRTATEYGVVRTYFDAVFTWTTGNYVGTGNTTGGTQYSGTLGLNAAGTGLVGSTSGAVNGTDGAISGGALGVYYAFIQFAGFTLGKAVSQFDAPWINYPGNNFDQLVGGSGTTNGVVQATYTADFGQGVTAAFSVQDQTQVFQTNVWNTAGMTTTGVLGGAYGTNNLGGTRAPDIVGMVRVDQAWGLFQASVAAHDNHAAYYGPVETSGHPEDKWGWAVQLALQIKNIPTGAGDVINISGVYTDGASRYNFQELAATSYSMFGSSNAAYQSIGFAGVSDAVFAPNGGLELTKTYGFRGAYTHNWNPFWNTALYGAWAAVNYSGTAKGLICGSTAFATLTGTCNPDFNIGQVGVITRWTPVKNLTFSADFTYSHLDQKYSGVITTGALTSVAKPGATYELKDQDTYSMLLRAQRNW